MKRDDFKLSKFNSKKIIELLKNKFLSDKMVRNIAVVSGGTAIGQIANMMFTPIITRVYSPSEYGILSVFSSILLIFSFSSLKYELAIPIAKKEDESVNILSLSILVLSIISLSAGLIVTFFGEQVLNLLNAESLFPYRFFIPIGIFFQGLYLIFNQWMFRIKNFKIISKTRVTQNLIGNVIKVILGLLSFGGIGLIIGRIVSVSAGTLSFYKKFTNRKKGDVKVEWRKIKNLAIKYRDFPMFQATSTGVVHFRNQFPVLFLAPLFGTQIVGLYGLANTIVKIPMTLIGQSVMDVFFAEIASIGKEDPKKIKKLSNNLFKKLVLVGSLPMLVLLLVGPTLFSLAFGAEWVEAGVYARILSISILANLIFSPISKVFEVFRRQAAKFIIDASSLIIIASVFLSANIFNWNAEITILLYSISMALVYFTTYLTAQSILNKEIKK
ncbi:lipopolysaccharide biosynthesis protein [Marinilactibacillus psychrotolerans]|uniref:lipopolysaccharide biosynthesis protein n=1 Tax=Marinilactibacillus psychrotolerans TaxID=191770 RepID=UPI00115FDFD6|nr:oligosaccharide flippase family protein [Marinilactibacillus psychrotolerans]